MLPFLPLSNLLLRSQICDSKKSLPFFSFSEVSVQTLSPRIQHSPSLSFWSHIYKLLYALDPYTQWLTFWFSVMPRIFSFLYLCTCSSFCQTWPALFSAGKILAYPLRSTSINISSEISLTSARGSTLPQSTLSKYPKRCVLILYLYICLLYLM